jgi:hypothetical protein
MFVVLITITAFASKASEPERYHSTTKKVRNRYIVKLVDKDRSATQAVADRLASTHKGRLLEVFD